MIHQRKSRKGVAACTKLKIFRSNSNFKESFFCSISESVLWAFLQNPLHKSRKNSTTNLYAPPFSFYNHQHFATGFNFKSEARAFLVAQWLRIRLPMQGTRVRALVWEDPTCHRATKPTCHNYWAWAPQLLKPACLEPVLHNKRSCRNEKPAHHNKV